MLRYQIVVLTFSYFPISVPKSCLLIPNNCHFYVVSVEIVNYSPGDIQRVRSRDMWWCEYDNLSSVWLWSFYCTKKAHWNPTDILFSLSFGNSFSEMREYRLWSLLPSAHTCNARGKMRDHSFHSIRSEEQTNRYSKPMEQINRGNN